MDNNKKSVGNKNSAVYLSIYALCIIYIFKVFVVKSPYSSENADMGINNN